jgi:hypothetical protein
LGGSTAVWPLAVRAQQSSNKIPVVGALWHAGSAEEEDAYLSVLVRAFNDLGYVEGKNIHLDHRFPAENLDRFRALAQELVDEKPDAIIAATPRGASELKKLTDTIPIVFVLVGDPVGFGFVNSLARRTLRNPAEPHRSLRCHFAFMSASVEYPRFFKASSTPSISRIVSGGASFNRPDWRAA